MTKKAAKKTAKKTAKKATTKQAKAFTEALSSFKAPEPPPQDFLEDGEVGFDEDGNAMRPLGEMRAVQLGGSTISLQEADKLDQGKQCLPDAPSLSQGSPQEPAQAPVPAIVPQTPPDASQSVVAAQALGQEPELEEKDVQALSRERVATNIEHLIDAINFCHARGYLKKLSEKDREIFKARIKTGRELVEMLRA